MVDPSSKMVDSKKLEIRDDEFIPRGMENSNENVKAAFFERLFSD
jgi:hypothetical protein